MQEILRYRGHVITAKKVAFIRELIGDHPTSSRYALSRKLCQAWSWVQANGQLRDMVCRGLMLALHRTGQIVLPPVRQVSRNPFVERSKLRPKPVAVDNEPLRGTLKGVGPLEFRLVRRTADEPLFNGLIEEHHYLGYTQPVGEHLKYVIYAGDRPVACFAWSSAPRHLGPRDRFIGWPPEARRRNIRLLAYNSRFLILPWIEIRYLASHLLGRMVKRLSKDWEEQYGHPVHFAETFVDPSRFSGTCYRAANWVYLGRTTGRGHNDRTNRANRPAKDVLGYPLSKNFREALLLR